MPPAQPEPEPAASRTPAAVATASAAATTVTASSRGESEVAGWQGAAGRGDRCSGGVTQRWTVRKEQQAHNPRVVRHPCICWNAAQSAAGTGCMRCARSVDTMVRGVGGCTARKQVSAGRGGFAARNRAGGICWHGACVQTVASTSGCMVPVLSELQAAGCMVRPPCCMAGRTPLCLCPYPAGQQAISTSLRLLCACLVPAPLLVPLQHCLSCSSA